MRVATWWREQSGPAKFRLYAQLTLPVAIAAVVVLASIVTAAVPLASAGIVVSGIAAILAVQAQPDLAAWSTPALRRWALPVGTSILIAVWLACVAANYLGTDDLGTNDSEGDAIRSTGLITALLLAQSVVPFLRYRWWIVVGIAIATGAALGSSLPGGVRLAALTAAIAAVIVASTLLTRWGLQIVEDLDRAKTIEAQLQVAEERLRFARDLHDVVGRGFSAIAVKSELAATLSRSGAADRAATEMEDVRHLAVESMNRMRDLVRGYRDINLEGEVAGARSLLAAAGCQLTIEGDPTRIPAQFHEVTAWVVREGTTNIVKHSAATTATMTFGDAGMSLRNNGVSDKSRSARDPAQQSGLRGLAERLTTVGAVLDTTATGDHFALEIRWEKS
ncbi:sensor histidine kinase [Antrihabitans sp. NCIMB 15449]|uniref:Sensor histidine kinase n=1 Tax=Antrihabitans spumae TaxID=3373370 RepID=A0ABW7JQR7_9NOCA